LILEARRVASTVIHGLHGRRRAGSGENFWQYRHFMSGEPAQNIDWRRSARDDHLYVREREWEASHTIWLWADRSPSMEFSSALTEWSKLDRALVVSFALAEVLVQGGERVGIPELMRPTANRNVIESMAQRIMHDTSENPSLPPNFAPAPFSEVVLLSDLWSPIPEFRKIIGQLAANGARGQLATLGGGRLDGLLLCVLAARRGHLLSDARLQARDDIRDRLAFGAGGESQRHAVLEDRLGQFEHVVDRWGEAIVEQGTGAYRQHQ
jgi:hypothetical protein